jgi:hypothetical protein
MTELNEKKDEEKKTFGHVANLFNYQASTNSFFEFRKFLIFQRVVDNKINVAMKR